MPVMRPLSPAPTVAAKPRCADFIRFAVARFRGCHVARKTDKEQGEEYRADFMYVGHKKRVHKDLSPLENLHTDFALQNRRPRYTLCETLALAGLDKEQNRLAAICRLGKTAALLCRALSLLIFAFFGCWMSRWRGWTMTGAIFLSGA